MTLFKTKRMRHAIQRGDIESVTKLLAVFSLPADPDNSRTFILDTIYHGQPEILSLLVAHGASPFVDCGEGRSILHVAARKKQVACGEIILKHAFNLLNAQNQRGHTPLIEATLMGNADFIGFLLKNGAAQNGPAAIGAAPIDIAMAQKNYEIATMFLLDRLKNDPAGAIEYALRDMNTGLQPNSVAEKLLKIIAEEGKDKALLLDAAKGGHVFLTRFLIEKKYKTDITDLDGNTPLHLASAFGQHDIVNLLLQNGADPKARNNGGIVPLAMARLRSHAKVIRIFEQKIKEDEKRKNERDGKWQPLHGDRIAHITHDLEIGYKLTEIFNFARHERTQIYHNLETNAESTVVRDFNEITEKEPLEEALRQLSATGVETEHLSIHGIIKNKLPLQGK